MHVRNIKQIFAMATQEGCFSGWLLKSQKMLHIYEALLLKCFLRSVNSYLTEFTEDNED